MPAPASRRSPPRFASSLPAAATGTGRRKPTPATRCSARRRFPPSGSWRWTATVWSVAGRDDRGGRDPGPPRAGALGREPGRSGARYHSDGVRLPRRGERAAAGSAGWTPGGSPAVAGLYFRTMSDHQFDLVIVGGGPAGLCAAMYAARAMLSAVLLERGNPGGELLNTEKVEDYPGFVSILGRDLAAKMAEHARAVGAEIRQENVEGIHRLPDGTFRVATGSGTDYLAPTVILTAGGTPTKLGVPGELEYAGRGVSYCAVCDGAFFKGDTIAVVGGGDAAVEEAEYLTRYASRVFIVHRREEFRASRLLQERVFANPKIEVIWNTRVLELIGDATGLKHLELENTITGGRSRLDATGCR